MTYRQRGALSLTWVAIVSAAFAALAMAALYSMRYERNVFMEVWNKALKSGAGAAVAHTSQEALGKVAPSAAPLRSCVVNGKHVISNVDCPERGSKIIHIHDSRGIEMPKAAPPVEPTPAGAQEKMIEQATR